MPSTPHEVLVDMFLRRPQLVAELLAGALHMELPKFTVARLSSAELTTLAPTEYRADAVVMLEDEERPLLGVVVEIQLSEAKQKRHSWPAYVTNLYVRFDCPAMVLVICPDRAVGRWCATPIRVGEPEFVLRPVVLGPGEVPMVTDSAAARRNPELAVLSAMAHGDEPDPTPVFEALLTALGTVDTDHADLYTELLLTLLPAAARDHLERLMTTAPTELVHSDYFRRAFRAGEAEGKAEGEAKALLAVLEARGFQVPDEDLERITACTDLDQLDAWVRRAVTATKVQDVFEATG